MTTAVQIANRIATDIRRIERLRPTDSYVPRVRNKRESREHGYFENALATVTYEGGIDLINLIGRVDYGEGTPYYVDAYASYLVGVFPR